MGSECPGHERGPVTGGGADTLTVRLAQAGKLSTRLVGVNPLAEKGVDFVGAESEVYVPTKPHEGD